MGAVAMTLPPPVVSGDAPPPVVAGCCGATGVAALGMQLELMLVDILTPPEV